MNIYGVNGVNSRVFIQHFHKQSNLLVKRNSSAKNETTDNA